MPDVDALRSEIDTLRGRLAEREAEVRRLQAIADGFAARIVQQSELLGRRAERPDTKATCGCELGVLALVTYMPCPRCGPKGSVLPRDERFTV
jgi:predicted RNA-binding Zn-ribbon protein involved in translation (DUF1610 family)